MIEHIPEMSHVRAHRSSTTYKVQEQFCPWDALLNNHCRRKDCEACPYSLTCTCTVDVKSGINCAHVRAVLLFATSDTA
ncbi:hypothetical protein Aduo_012112 [Ancylostoma duodenale]